MCAACLLIMPMSWLGKSVSQSQCMENRVVNKFNLDSYDICARILL